MSSKLSKEILIMPKNIDLHIFYYKNQSLIKITLLSAFFDVNYKYQK